jgi:hypothetical protein
MINIHPPAEEITSNPKKNNHSYVITFEIVEAGKTLFFFTSMYI